VPFLLMLFRIVFCVQLYKLGRVLWQRVKPRRPYDPEMN
jgi:hypothetical protein